MPLFGRKSRARNELLRPSSPPGPAGMVVSGRSPGSGSTGPRRLVTTSLAEQATTAALAHFAEGRLIPEAELQFAIYPWDYGEMARRDPPLANPRPPETPHGTALRRHPRAPSVDRSGVRHRPHDGAKSNDGPNRSN
jgi:hypothetical protein